MNRKGLGRTAAQHPASQQRSRRGSSSIAAALWLLLLSCLIGVALLGCNPPPRPEFNELSRSVAPDETAAEEPEELPDLAPPLQPFTEPWETWQSYHIGGRHIGYSHVRAELQSDEPDSPVQIVLQDQVMLRRGPATIVQRLDQTSLETRAGELLSFEAQLRVGPALTRFV